MYTFCGKQVDIRNNKVYLSSGQFIGHLYEDELGGKHVYGPVNKGPLEKETKVII